MSARDEILSSLRPGSRIPRLLDDYRAEVLTEAADHFEQRRLARADIVTDFDRGRRAAEGRVVEELRELADTREKATAAAATATPDTLPTGPAINELRRLVRAAAPLWGAPARYCDADIDSYTNRLYLAIRAEILDSQTTEGGDRDA